MPDAIPATALARQFASPLISWNESYSCFTLLSNEACAYYLPAFMVTSIYYCDDFTTKIEGFIFSKLVAPQKFKEIVNDSLNRLEEELPEELRVNQISDAQQMALDNHRVQEFEEFVTILTSSEQRAVKHFLQHMAETYDHLFDLAAEALHRYWDRVPG